MLEQWNVDEVMQKQLNKDTIAVIVTIWVGGQLNPGHLHWKHQKVPNKL